MKGAVHMSMSHKVLVKVYTGLVSAAVTVAAQRALTAGWKAVTGADSTPNPNDPDTPVRVAVVWALASGIGLGAAQLFTARFTERRLRQFARS